MEVVCCPGGMEEVCYGGCKCPLFSGGESSRLIVLSKGKFATVDSEDHGSLCRFNWSAVKGGRTFYAVRYEGRKQIFMHRQITDAPGNLVVDHVDHNGLNNCKNNLRVCTRAQNGLNQRTRKNKTSKYKGVYYHKRDKRYCAQISYKGKRYYLGTFKNELDAAMAYDEAARELFGEFAFTGLTALTPSSGMEF